MKALSLSALLGATLLAGAANAQAFNLDIQAAPSTLPSSTFGAFPGQAGIWDAIGPNVTTPTAMNDVTGGTTGATYTYAIPSPGTVAQLTAASYAPVVPSAGARALFDDYVPGNPNNQIRFQNLQPGKYRFYVYAWTPNGMSTVHFQIAGNGAGGNAMNHLSFPSAEFVDGQTFVAKTLTVGLGDVVIITALCDGVLMPNGDIGSDGGPGQGQQAAPHGPGDCSFAGFQIVPVNGTQGCNQVRANSLGGFPRINAFGTTNMAGAFDSSANGGMGDIDLSAGSLPGAIGANRRILTFVSNNFGAGVGQYQPNCQLTDPDIMRCLTPGPVYRVDTPTDLTNAAGVYVTDVDLIALGNQGLNVSAGSTLHFQMVYEDDSVTGDACQVNPILRWTKTISIDLY